MKNLTWKIPVNWTRRAIVEVDAEGFDEAVSIVEGWLNDATPRSYIASKTKEVVDIPWSYEVDIDACDVYQTPEALERMFPEVSDNLARLSIRKNNEQE